MSAAASAGFLMSAGLLALGVTAPGLRYPIATAGGYVTFLALIRLWLALRRDERGWDGGADGLDLLDAATGDAGATPIFDGGGGFGGGGSSASFTAPGEMLEAKSTLAEQVVSAADGADEGVVWLVPLLLAGAVVVGLGASVSVLYQAPALFAEVLLDGAIATAVYRSVRQRGADHWSAGVVRRTWKPIIAITLALTVLGVSIPYLVPGADSIGDLFR